ncbi:hypothetical protein ACIBW9_18470 [Streptomyces sp. NPDC049541]|uniref:hypothetical protein n=1 Tax=Streptomyces sp. NPDC049541 TaxID=3365594 RepID=UPI0037937604
MTSMDPIVDGDGTWLPMTTSVTGPAFTYDGKTWKAPAGSSGLAGRSSRGERVPASRLLQDAGR